MKHMFYGLGIDITVVGNACQKKQAEDIVW